MKKKIFGGIAIALLLVSLVTAGIWMLNQEAVIPIDTSNKAGVEWYNLNDKEFTISTADELYGLAKLSNYYNFSGQTIKLGADIVINEGNATEWEEKAPERRWFPIKKFAGTFDGQGHTISGMYASGKEANLAMFSGASKSAVIRDFRLVNSYFSGLGSAGVAALVSNGGGTYERIYTDAIVQCDGEYAAGFASLVKADLTLKECWFDGSVDITGRYMGGFVDYTEYSMVRIEHCLNTGNLNSTYESGGGKLGGFCGVVHREGATLTVTDSISAGEMTTINKYYAGSVLGVCYGGTTTVIENAYALASTYDVSIGRSGSQGTLKGSPVELRSEELTGKEGYCWTNLNFDTYWTTVENDIPMLRYFAEETQEIQGLEKAFDTSWYNQTDTEFVINTREELYGLYYVSIGDNFKDKVVKLGSDIVINEGKATDWAKEAPRYNWYPIKPFSGTFDGQGHTISGLYINTNSELVGLFSLVNAGSVIKNVKLTNGYYYNGSELDAIMGSVAGRGNGLFDTIYSDVIMVSSGRQVGGISAAINQEGENTHRNCWFNGSISMKTLNGIYAGGIVANIVKGTVTVENCLNTGQVSFESKDKGMFIGGIVGTTMNENTVIKIKDCLNVGKVVGPYDVCVGAVVGRHNKKVSLTIENTYAARDTYEHPKNGFMGVGTESSTDDIKGGVIGHFRENLTGYAAYQWTNLDFAKYWSVDLKGTPILKSFATKSPSVAGIEKLFNLSWYNEKSDTYVLNSAKDVNGFQMIGAQNYFIGKTVKLGADVVLNKADAQTKSQWIPIPVFAGTFDGQGHTISGLYVKTSASEVGLFGETTKDSVIKNLSLKDSYLEYTGDGVAKIGSIAGNAKGTFDSIYSNATVVSNGTLTGGIAGVFDGDAQHMLNKCWFDGSVTGNKGYIGGLTGYVNNGVLTIQSCMYTGCATNELQDDFGYVAGFVGYFGSASKHLYIKDSLCAGEVKTYATHAVGSMVSRARKPVTIENSYTTDHLTNLLGKTIGKKSTVAGLGDFSANENTVVGAAQIRSEEQMLGAMAFDTELSLHKDGAWVARNAKIPALKPFVPAGDVLADTTNIVPDTSWYTKNPSASVFKISDKEDLYGLIELSKAHDFAGKTIELTNSIAVNSVGSNDNRWKPIAKFAGTLDGKGYTISGLHITTANSNIGLFAELTKDAKVTNLRLRDSRLEYVGKGEANIGSIAGTCNGTLDTVYSNATVVSNGTITGGLIGSIDEDVNTTIRNCWFDGTVQTSMQMSAGIVAYIRNGNVTIEDCLSSGKIITTNTTQNIAYTGGVVGRVFSIANAQSNLTIKDTVHTGQITTTSTGGVGSVIGRARNPVTFGAVYSTDKITQVDGKAIEYQYTVKGVGNFSINEGNKVDGEAIIISEEKLTGNKAFDNTVLKFFDGGKWAARRNQLVALNSFIDASEILPLNEQIIADTGWYDKNPNATEFYISSAEELYGLVQISQNYNFASKKIYLTRDIIVNRGDAKEWENTPPVNAWTPISSGAWAFNGRLFDGQGHTISGLYGKTTSQKMGLFATMTYNSNVCNLRLENSYFEFNGSGMAKIGSIAGAGKGVFDTIYSNAIIKSSGSHNGGLVGFMEENVDKHKMINCWFDGKITANLQNVGGLLGTLYNGTLTMENCLNTGEVISKWNAVNAYAGGLIGQFEKAGLSVKNSLQAGKISLTNAAVGAAGSVIGNAYKQPIFENVYTTDNITNEKGEKPSLNLVSVGVGKANANSVAPSKAAIVKPESEFKGEKAFELPFDFSATGSWVARKDNIPALKSFVNADEICAGQIIVDTGWYDKDPNASVFYISNANELYGLVQVSRTDGFANKTIKLTQDIVVNEGTKAEWEVASYVNAWTPISPNESGALNFNGTFDGQGHTIRGLYGKTSSMYMGLFGAMTRKAVIKNLRLENSYFEFTGTGVAQMGSITGLGKGLLENVYSDAVVVNNGSHASGMVGRVSGSAGEGLVIRNCWFNGTVISAKQYVGGFVGQAVAGNLTMENCLMSGTVQGKYTASLNAYAGGFIGSVDATVESMALKKCLCTGTISVEEAPSGASHKGATGSLIGNTYFAITFEDVYTTNKVEKPGSKEVKYTSAGVGYANDNSVAPTNSATIVTPEQLKGDSAITNAPGLDFENIWSTMEDGTPVLKSMKK